MENKNNGAFNDIFNNFYRLEYEAQLSEYTKLKAQYEALKRQCHSFGRRNHSLTIVNQTNERLLYQYQTYINDCHTFMCASVQRDPSLDQPYLRFLRSHNAVQFDDNEVTMEAMQQMEHFFEDTNSQVSEATTLDQLSDVEIDWNELADLMS